MPRFIVHEAEVDGPGTHLLVIGVGKYPHLIGGESPCKNPDGMGQLSSPPISARHVAEWFITDYHDPGKELASVALLLSEHAARPFENPATGAMHAIEDANGDNSEAAIKEWKGRANSDANNRLFFYFCGHGVSQGDDMALLTSDFCSDEDNALKGAIDLRMLMNGLKSCQASEQVFLIDACRASSDVLIGQGDVRFAGRVPLLPGNRPAELPKRLPASFYSTLAGDKAYAREDSVSLFTEALLKSLRGAASDNPDGYWRVTTTRLQEAVDDFMKQPVFAGEVAGVQVPIGGQLPGFQLHYLKGEPEVPVYVGCYPQADNKLAEFVCTHGGEERARRPLADVDPADPMRLWALDLILGDYEFRAEFAGGQPRSESLTVRPPHRSIELKAAE